MTAPVTHTLPRQLLTSVADYHELLLITAPEGIRSLLVLPDHPYYRCMVPQITGDKEVWRVCYRDFWGLQQTRRFNTAEAAKVFVEMVLTPLRIERTDIWPGQGLRIADIADADKLWRTEACRAKEAERQQEGSA